MPSVDESLADPVKPSGGNRLVKNLHILIPGTLIAVLVFVLMMEAFKQDQLAPSGTLSDQAAAEINKKLDETSPPLMSDIESEFARQRKVPLGGPQLPRTLGPEPSGLPPVPEGTPMRPEQREAELDRLKREEEIRSSPLLALSGKAGGGFGGGGSASDSALANSPVAAIRQQGNEQREKIDRMREELLRVARGGMGGAGPATGRPGVRAGAPSTMGNSDWLHGLSQSGGATREVIGLEDPAPTPILHQGGLIPAVLISELNSDLPGQMSAMVTIDVYDSVRGDHLLIPKGSKLVGSYNSDVTAGQERVMAAFTRLIRPDGSSVDLRAMQAADTLGQSGLSDEVNTHFWKMFSTSFMVAGLAYLFEREQPDTVVVTGGGSGQDMSSEAGRILTDVSRTVLDRYKVIPPTLIIRKGHKFNVVVNRDISIPAYR